MFRTQIRVSCLAQNIPESFERRAHSAGTIAHLFSTFAVVVFAGWIHGQIPYSCHIFGWDFKVFLVSAYLLPLLGKIQSRI